MDHVDLDIPHPVGGEVRLDHVPVRALHEQDRGVLLATLGIEEAEEARAGSREHLRVDVMGLHVHDEAVAIEQLPLAADTCRCIRRVCGKAEEHDLGVLVEGGLVAVQVVETLGVRGVGVRGFAQTVLDHVDLVGELFRGGFRGELFDGPAVAVEGRVVVGPPDGAAFGVEDEVVEVAVEECSEFGEGVGGGADVLGDVVPCGGPVRGAGGGQRCAGHDGLRLEVRAKGRSGFSCSGSWRGRAGLISRGRLGGSSGFR